MTYADVRLALALGLVFSTACAPLKTLDENDRDGKSRADAGEADAARGDNVDDAHDAKRAGGSGGASAAGAGGKASTTNANTAAGAGGGTTNSNKGPGTSNTPMADGSLACPESVPANAMAATGTANGAINWSGAVHVKGTFSLRNASTKLTIAAGTQVFVEPDGLIEIGWNGQQHEIEVQGTEASPVRFCRAKRTGANWRGIVIGGGVLSSSALKYAVIEGAGQGGDALVLGTGILIDHVWVRDSASNGVQASDFRDDSADLTVTSSAAAPLVLSDSPAVHHLPRGGKFTGNKEDVAHVTFSSFSLDTQFHEIGIPYQLDRGLSQRGMSKLDVDPGVEWRVGIDQGIELGWNGARVEVHMDGTEAKPIVIRGADERKGSWSGMVIQGGVFATSTLKFVTISHGGGTDGAGLSIHAPLTASDITLKDNAHEAFYLDGVGLAEGSGRFRVTGTKGTAGRVEPNALVTLPAGASYRGNDDDYLEVTGGDISRTGTIPEVDVPLHVLANVTVRMGATLTIAPGVEFQMQDGVAWDVGWNSQMVTLMAVGTPEKPILFRGILEQAGYWDGIVIGGNVSSASKIEFVNIGDGGGGRTAGANLHLHAAISVVNAKLYGSATYGMIADADFPQDYEHANTFVANVMGTVQRK